MAPEPAGLLQVTLYGRQGCHLCEDAAQMLADIRQEVTFALTECDITTSMDLLSRYVFRIPVIALPDGKEIDWPTTHTALRLAIQQAINS